MHINLFKFLSRFKIHKQQPHPVTFPTTKKKRKPRSGTIDWQEFLQLLGVVAEGFGGKV